MHPPRIILLIVLVGWSNFGASENSTETSEENDGDSVSAKKQREAIERERRLIPYVTYYVTRRLADPNGGEGRSVLIPVASSPDAIFRPSVASRFRNPSPDLQNVDPRGFRSDAKSPVEIPPDPYYYSAQVGRSRYETGAEDARASGRSGIPLRDGFSDGPAVGPQIIKIIPVVTKLPSYEKTQKFLGSAGDPRFIDDAYASPKLQTFVPRARGHYEGPVVPGNQNSYEGNRIYNVRPLHRPRIFGVPTTPDDGKYAVAKVILTTPAPHPNDGLRFDPEEYGSSKTKNSLAPISPVHLVRLNPTPALTRRPTTTTTYVLGPSTSRALPYSADVLPERSGLPSRSRGPEPLLRSRVPQEGDVRFVAAATPVPVTNDLESVRRLVDRDRDRLKAHEEDKQTLVDLISILKETNKLPQNLTPDNIGNGMETLALILERLRHESKPESGHPSSESSSASEPSAGSRNSDRNKVHSFPQPSGTSTPGRPGVDYPTYASIPRTDFDCSTQRYKGFFGDPETGCQVWHYCDLNGGQASFLCPNGTIFNQVALTCDWWFNVKCESTSQLYVLNERLYKYILPFSPSFPEDYSGPVVDRYLAAKFKEMETKSKIKALKSVITTTESETQTDTGTETTTAVPGESQTIGGLI